MNVPSSVKFQSVSWSRRLCLQTPGTSCRPSQRPDRWLELFPPPALTTTHLPKSPNLHRNRRVVFKIHWREQIMSHHEWFNHWFKNPPKTTATEIEGINTSKWHLHTFRCQTHSRGVCWIPSLCRWKWISFYLFCRLHRKIFGGVDSCAARPGKQQRPQHSLFTLFMSFGNKSHPSAVGIWLRLSSKYLPNNITHFCLGIEYLHSINGDLQLHFWDLLSLWLLDVSLKLSITGKKFFSLSAYGLGKLEQTKAWHDSTINGKQCGKQLIISNNFWLTFQTYTATETE